MNKIVYILVILLSCAFECAAQNTTVTATVTDPNTIPYAFSTGYAALVCPGNQAATYNGFSVPRTFSITGFNGAGTFTQVVYDVSLLVPTGCGYQWHITYKDGVTNFITGTIASVTGGSVNESSAISAFAVLLPAPPVTTPPGGSNAQLQYNNSGTFGGALGTNVTSATGAISLTAGADTTIPLDLIGHSSTQSATILDINNNDSGSPAGFPFTVRGTGAGSPAWSAGGGHALAQFLTEDATAVGLVVMNKSQAGSGLARPGVALYVDSNGIPQISGGNSTGDGSGNYSALEFHANASIYGATSSPALLATLINAAGNGTVPLTLFQPIGSAGPAANNSFQICRGAALGFCLAGFDSGGAPGSPATNINLFFNGSTSGTAKIGAAAVAGTPCIFVLPTASPSAGQFLQSAAPSSGSCQTSWVSATQLICSGQIALTTGAISSGTRATNTLSCTGLSASTDAIDCTFSGDTNAVTGYAPSASGGLTLKTWVSTNTINVDQVNNTSGSITPGAATVNCKAIR